MSQPNKKVWHLRIAETPRQDGETPYEYYRRMAVKYNTTFQNTRLKICKHLKEMKLAEANEKGYIPTIDSEGINYEEVKHGWLKTKPNEKGRSHSLFFKVNHDVDFLDNLIVGLKGYQFCAPNLGKKTVSNSIGLINLFDAHIDKVCIVDNTHTDSSIERNIEHFKRAFVALFDKCLLAEKIIFPIGNDFYNANDEKNTTVRGTPQDSLFDWKDSFSKGVELIRWCVDYMLQAGKPVDLITVYSNHDSTKLFYLSKCIELIYAGNENVTIDLQGVQRKYNMYGANLFGFAHGDKEKTTALPLLMATERRKDWGNVRNCFWFLGDKHHEKTFMFKKSLDMPSVEVHWLRAVATSDNWHYQAGYIGVPKTAYCYIFDKEHGLTTTHRQPF
jgi:acetone carboxylase gamma subunit